ncbi:ABC transporter substrate-binding protein [Piscinibacter terrae]|uniref:ABC transporter substrate-binding protein n=1 Tax=Piscinibacter terrae TaxID=2496871 RepID=A0A3N7HTN6_9BURK|nr:ABC transporter substrate-binding protein [Albitalea terrae]RQP25143.1 ABC transporter substrate-binding protein [Albitalea terrae]
MHSLNRRRVIGAAIATMGANAAWPITSKPSGDAIVIGQSAPVTGPVADAFKGVLTGEKLAFDQINRKGGINGRRVDLILLDDAYDTRRTVENVKTLIERDNVIALTGLGSTAGVGAALPILAEKKVPLVGVYTGAPNLRMRHHPYFFTTQASFKDEVFYSVRNLVTLNQSRIAVVYQNNEFGKLMLPVAEAAMKELGATFVGSAPLAIDGSDAVAAAQAVAAKQPQAVLMIAVGPSVVGYVKANRNYVSVPIYTISTALGMLPALGDEARGLAITQVIPYPWRQTTGMAREFALECEHAKVPVAYDTYGGYLLARFLLEALKRTGKNVTSEALVKVIESQKSWDYGGINLAFGPGNHHGTSFVETTIVGPRMTFMR